MKNRDADIVNEPVSAATAQELWNKDRDRFKLWVLGLVGAEPVKKNARVDGTLSFIESDKKKRKIIVQVKGGEIIVPGMIKDIVDNIEKEGAEIGLIICLQNPRLAIITDSVHAGSYDSALWKKKFLKVQIRTVTDLLEGKKFDIPQTSPRPQKPKRKKSQAETSRLI